MRVFYEPRQHIRTHVDRVTHARDRAARDGRVWVCSTSRVSTYAHTSIAPRVMDVCGCVLRAASAHTHTRRGRCFRVSLDHDARRSRVVRSNGARASDGRERRARRRARAHARARDRDRDRISSSYGDRFFSFRRRHARRHAIRDTRAREREGVDLASRVASRERTRSGIANRDRESDDDSRVVGGVRRTVIDVASHRSSNAKHAIDVVVDDDVVVLARGVGVVERERRPGRGAPPTRLISLPWVRPRTTRATPVRGFVGGK